MPVHTHRNMIILQTVISFSTIFGSSPLIANETPEKNNTPVAVAPQTQEKISGKVIETMDVNYYTYVLLEKDTTKTWVAVPKMSVAVGDTLEMWKGIEMKDFHSTKLNRKFETIFFSSGLVTDSAAADDKIMSIVHRDKPADQMVADKKETSTATETKAPPQTPEKIPAQQQVETPTQQEHTLDKNRHQDEEMIKNAHGGQGLAELKSGKAPTLDTLPQPIEKAAGANAYTIGEIHEKQKDLTGKEVVVRGRVVKIAAGILKMNWIHLQDGSGDVSSGTHDLVITANELPEANDIVTMSGTVHLNKDFGAGYKYNLILMDGKKL